MKLSGSLVKMVDKINFFQKTPYPKRYFVIDYSSGMVIIKHNYNVLNSYTNNTTIPFRDFIAVSPRGYDNVTNNHSKKPYIYPFFVKTINRTYLLFGSSDDER